MLMLATFVRRSPFGAGVCGVLALNAMLFLGGLGAASGSFFIQDWPGHLFAALVLYPAAVQWLVVLPATAVTLWRSQRRFPAGIATSAITLLAVNAGVLTLMHMLVSASDPYAPSRAELDAFVSRAVDRSGIEGRFGRGYTRYDPGTTELDALLSCCSLDHCRTPGVYAPVCRAVKDKRRIIYYTTMWQQTWLFLDDSNRLVGYWLNSQ
jgi:hypothetical protein